ncbi:acetate--CoA ligase family protein [Microbacterium pseudoresistens]|uniref:Acetyltransferase n=1 Tax=Microbacterium pseudoresistens TaxID=640634 RepID=A0A7Y9EVT2_9MICO|nr:acetate--CoA ligase family protein [Microbacterium pseudoresistens]NYD54884.1 acetyltransferase [Microbacterium pseudoresistens]
MAVSSDSIRTLFDPKHIALVGAQEGGFTEVIRRNLSSNGFRGTTQFVNPSRDEVWGERVYASLSALPQPPEHVAVLVSAKHVPTVIEEAIAVGAKSATVYASEIGGASEGPEAELAAQIGAAIAGADFAMTGPNCLGNFAAQTGFANLTAKIELVPDPAPIAVVGQSGGVILFAARALHKRGAPIAYAVTTGNELGSTTADFIEYFADDEGVRVIMVFLEAIRDREAFIRACVAARRTGTSVVAVKIGGTDEVRESAKAHTGALVGSIEAFDALCEDLGVIRAHTLEEGIELLNLLGHAKRPRNDGVAAVVYSGGLRSLILEAAEEHGVEFAALRDETVSELEALLPMGGHVGNPLDIGFLGLTRPEVFSRCVQILTEAPEFGTVLVQENLPDNARTPRSGGYLRRIEDIARKTDTSISAFSLLKESVTGYGAQFRRELRDVGVLQGVDDAIAALARERASRQPSAGQLAMTAPTKAAVATIDQVSSRPDAVASEPEGKALLKEFGITVPPEFVAHSESELLAAAGAVGYPVVLKAVTAEVTHKSDLGLVELGIADERALVDAYARIAQASSRSHVALEGVLVTPMFSGGVELILGAKYDVEVGHVVMVGSGGLLTELHDDIVIGRAESMTTDRAEALLRRTKIVRVLEGYRGGPAYDVAAVTAAMTRMAEMVTALPQVQVIEVNPLLALRAGRGAVALDVVLSLGDRTERS